MKQKRDCCKIAIPVIHRNPSRCQIRDLDAQFLRGPNGAVAIRNFPLKRTDSHRKCRLLGGIFFGMTGKLVFCNSPFYCIWGYAVPYAAIRPMTR